MKIYDMQIHTTASDGKFSPSQIVNLAVKKRMKGIAITDHDKVAGIEEAINYSKNKNIEIIPGIEITCKEDFYEEKIHILGLFIDYKNKELNEFLKKIKEVSMKEAIEVIRKASGINILSHPGRYLNQMLLVINKFILSGGDGLEVDYPYDKILQMGEEKSDFVNNKLREIAKEKNLLISGGSDFHDFERGSEIGDGGLTEEEFERLKRSLKEYQ